MYQKLIARCTAISFTSVLIVCAFLPVFFLPATWSGLGAVKGLILYVGVFIAASFWLLAQFIDGSLTFPKHKTFLALLLWVLLALVSALASANVHVSLWGRGFVVDSFATILVLALLTFLIASFARQQKYLVRLFLAMFAGSVLTVFLQVVLYVSQKVSFVAKYLPHVANQGTLVGSWVDFAHFVTFTLILSLLMYEVLTPKGFFKKLSLVSIILSVLVLVFLNFKIAWIVTIVSALLVFVYKSSVERSVARFFQKVQETTEVPDEHPRFPLLSFITLLIGLFFFLSNASIGNAIASRAGIAFNDIRPSLQSTILVDRAALWRDPLFGAGQGRYTQLWNLYHPVEINTTQFWNTTFDSGFSTITTTLATNGILPTLALLTLLVLSLIHGFRLFNSPFPDRFSRFIAVAAFIMLLAFFGLFVLTSPGIVLVAFGFMYLGLLLGVSSLIGTVKITSFNYLRDPRLSFFAILLIVLAIMSGCIALYFSGNRFAGIVAYNRALLAQDFAHAQSSLDRALRLSPNDIYWRTRSALFMQQFTASANATSPNKSELQTYFTQAEQSARSAVAWDTTDANNWLGLSQVYQLVAATDNQEAYKNAKDAGDNAVARSPQNPIYLLNEAQLMLIKKNTTGALEFIRQALVLKSDYLDAFVLRAQIRNTLGQTTAPVEELLAYTTAAPFDEQGFLLLGQAYVGVRQYQNAFDTYTQASKIAPTDPAPRLNAINTLLLMGNKDQAIDALKTFKTQFPDITGVDEKITELQKQPVAAPEQAPTQKQ